VSTETELRDALATCARIMAMQELLGLFGHISAFDPQTQRVYMSPSKGVDKTAIEGSHILPSDLDGKVLDSDQTLPIEWPIHTVLHRQRSDALAVAHLHSPYSTLFSISEQKFRPLTLQGAVLDGEMPLYRDTRLVKTMAQGEDLARTMGDRPIAFMRGHGVVVVARNVEQMLYLALILEDEARKAVDVASLGAHHHLTHEECSAFDGHAELEGRSQRSWRYFSGLEKRWNRQPGTGHVPFV
jgi:ribulose-5-phosphate 4-epimerase/fuculose-1-phosphate aldolase